LGCDVAVAVLCAFAAGAHRINAIIIKAASHPLQTAVANAVVCKGLTLNATQS
jgi:hypothetical protein